ncbi:MAG TPA: M28 family peptidase, partial [Desulfobacterales bacterium]|nr:M28 family peptidase [Desulfobacterales bacterium]
MRAAADSFRLPRSRRVGRPRCAAAAVLACALLATLLCGRAFADDAPAAAFAETIRTLAAFGDRSTGAEGNGRAAAYLRSELEALFPGAVATQAFTVPVIRAGDGTLSVPGRAGELRLRAVAGNALTPPAVPAPGLSGPLVYVGRGELAELNGRPVEGAILLMELDSGRAWLTAADLGAGALVYIDRGGSPRTVFEDKLELSPLRFPRFWATAEEIAHVLGDVSAAPGGIVADAAGIRAEAAWENAASENITCLIPGTSAERRKELLVVEAFYDSTAQVAGLAPGADEAMGAATLLQLARALKERPPERTVLLAATSGHAQALAGLRELVWTLTARSKDLRDARSDLRRAVQRARTTQDALESARFDG